MVNITFSLAHGAESKELMLDLGKRSSTCSWDHLRLGPQKPEYVVSSLFLLGATQWQFISQPSSIFIFYLYTQRETIKGKRFSCNFFLLEANHKKKLTWIQTVIYLNAQYSKDIDLRNIFYSNTPTFLCLYYQPTAFRQLNPGPLFLQAAAVDYAAVFPTNLLQSRP